MTLDDRIDELYGLPLERFTAERDSLVKELRAAGSTEDAATVKALRKPIVSAWALNALAREDPNGVRELLELGGRLREAHHRAVSGGDGELLRVATEQRRALVSGLTRKAGAILTRQGSTADADQIASTLEAASVDPEAGELLRSGRMIKPLRPPAVMPDAGLRIVEGGARTSKAASARTSSTKVAALERELKSAQARERRAGESVERERARMADLEHRRTEARERLQAAEAELRGASLEARRISARLAKLR